MSLYPELTQERLDALPALAQAIVVTDRAYENLMHPKVIYFGAIPAMKKCIAERAKLVAAAHAVYGKSATSPTGAKA